MINVIVKEVREGVLEEFWSHLRLDNILELGDRDLHEEEEEE